MSFLIVGLLAVIIIVAVALINKKIKKKQFLKGRNKIADFPHQHMDYQYEIRLIKRMLPALQSRTVQKNAAPALKEIEIIYGRTDITQSLLALVEKYSLGTFTIATSDGLIFASSGGENSPTDAATYSNMVNDPLLTTPLVIVSGLTHKGSTLVGVIRTQNPVSEDISKRIASDTQAILNWWA
jgi:hypothetical protein